MNLKACSHVTSAFTFSRMDSMTIDSVHTLHLRLRGVDGIYMILKRKQP